MAHQHLVLRYFDEIVPVEREAINKRRAKHDRQQIGPPRPLPGETPPSGGGKSPLITPPPFPYPGSSPGNERDIRRGGDDPPDLERTRPRPEPRDLTGLALSGGGIRSAAVCLGALQALEVHGSIERIDYLSTVSGGGYIGTSMTVGMSTADSFPFQRPGDPRDTDAVGHIRNYSNFLLPRATSGVRNVCEAAAIILRGILANAVLVASVLLGFALLTNLAYRSRDDLLHGSFVAQLLRFSDWIGPRPFQLTMWTILVLCVLLLLWVLLRSGPQGRAIGNDSDVASPWVRLSTVLLLAALVFGFFDVQPLLILALASVYESHWFENASFMTALAGATGFVSTVAGFSGKIGQFLKATEHSRSSGVLVGRITTQALIWFAALLLPLLLLVVYLHLAAWGTADLKQVSWPSISSLYLPAFAVTILIGVWFKPNSYSLNQLYRDRLGKAFLFDPRDPENCPRDRLKLSDIDTSRSPYHLINAAMNVQGSLAANQRGREADFFVFSPDFIGSDLTLYASTIERGAGHAETSDMEREDPMLDVARAMAISGAAFSANMGSSTIRPLSPTLALLNVRLGYWLRNPRDLAKLRYTQSLAEIYHRVAGKFYLLLEMLNLLDEKSRRIYLSDGGHIENLGVYELLKRGCQLIVAVDAECDPDMAFSSLIKMERYARIDLGIRIDLPWERIAEAHKGYESRLTSGALPCLGTYGPHCAVGRVLYPDGSEGILVYLKSSLTGDETDYVLDYKKRNPSFPHETTGDQFFSEEQFEAYRALGFHVTDSALSGTDNIAISEELLKRPGLTPPEMLRWIRSVL